jgi:K+-sensing histidine kinase KdpD
MGQGLKKFWLYTKLAVIILVVAWVTLFFVKNSGESSQVNVWVFPFVHVFDKVSLAIIVPVTAIVSIVVFYIIRKITGVLHQLTRMREADRTREHEKKMEDLARQVEQKLSSAEPPKPSGS